MIRNELMNDSKRLLTLVENNCGTSKLTPFSLHF